LQPVDKSFLKRIGRSVFGPNELEEVSICHTLTRNAYPIMIDVGGHVGTSLLPFAKNGWTVHTFEPDPQNREELVHLAAPYSRVVVNDRAISETDDEILDLYTSNVSTGISTLAPFHETHQATAQVKTTRLDTYLEANQVSAVGFLKIDTEGHDLTVLSTFPWNRIHPSVVLCEFEDRKTIGQGHTYRDLADLLVSKGYAVIVSEWNPIVEYGNQHTWRRANTYPIDLADNAWGNLLAVDPSAVPTALRLIRLASARLRVRYGVDRLARMVGGA
jgi:FkbM family methyltransferase